MAEKGNLTMAEVRFWNSEAKSCVERQKVQLIQKNNYPFLINYYEGVERIDAAHPHVAVNSRMAVINEYFPNTNSLISELMYQNPDMMLEALRPEAEEDLPIMKSALSYLFDKSGQLIENRVGLFDMLYAGYSAIEVDQIPPSEKDAPINEPEVEEGKGSVFDQFTKGVKNAFNLKDAEDNLAKLSPPMETNFSTVQGTYVRRYDPLDVPLDWRAERIKDRRYNLKQVWLSKAEFDAKYPKFKDKVNVEEDRFEFAKHDLQLHNRKVLLYEFQVRLKNNQYQTIIISPHFLNQEIDSFLRPYNASGFNMKIGTLHKYGKAYPVSFAQVNKTMQDELNGYVRHMMEVAERNVPKFVTNKDKVKLDAKTALTSKDVNALVEVDGNVAGAVEPLQPTHVSFENKELMSIFQDQKNKLWSTSEPTLGGKASAKFATEIAVQEQASAARNIDVQEGLRQFIVEQLDMGKDLIVNFWDEEVFLKVTGHSKMDWYEPVTAPDPNNPEKSIILNPLAELLTADYFVNIDIASASRPNRDQQLVKMTAFMEQLVSIRQILIEQGVDINVEEIKRVSKDFGWNPDEIFIPHNPGGVPSVPTAGGENISPEEDARRQAEAEAQSGGV